jgi:hypothetical protein
MLHSKSGQKIALDMRRRRQISIGVRQIVELVVQIALLGQHAGAIVAQQRVLQAAPHRFARRMLRPQKFVHHFAKF